MVEKAIVVSIFIVMLIIAYIEKTQGSGTESHVFAKLTASSQ